MNADTFGGWIKARRKKLDITQEMLAQRVGCSLSAIRKIENDERRPSRQIAELLALHLEVPPEEQTLFLKIARGDGSVHRLNSVSTPTPSTSLRTSDKLVADSESLFPASNIPASTSPFIGRQQERESLAAMLSDPRQRLITILGPGGIGKTRLAMEVATAQLPNYDDLVYFIQLAAYNAPDSILPAIASVFNLPSSNTEELKNRLGDYLRDKKTLVVLDNFEHLMEGAPQISELLKTTPLLKILVTSRERLNLQGEWTFELSGLSIPPKADEGKAVYSALQLFELHIQRMRPDMQLTSKDREAAIRICQLVDGMPLAIELAATWIDVLSCAEIADEIERGFDFLSSSQRDIPERHRSLRAVFEYSWKRLSKQEQNVLSGLSIFQGGFRFHAAESVVGADRGVLLSLVSKSLVRRSPDGRFSLHEVIRQYAGGHLENESDLRTRHGKYYIGLLQPREFVPIGRDEDIDTLRELSAEYGNMRIAWNHAVKNKMYDEIDRVLDNSWLVYAITGWFQEGINETLTLAQSLRGKAETHAEKLLLARALMSVSGYQARVGELNKADQFSDESIEILRSLGNIEYLANELIAHSRVLSNMGSFARAHQFIEEGRELASRGTNPWMFGIGFVNLGYILGQEGDYERAWESFRSGLSAYKELGDVHSMRAFALNGLGYVLIQMGHFDEAQDVLQESLVLNSQIHDRWGVGTSLGRLGFLSLRRGELVHATTLLKRSLSLFTELGMRWDTAWVLTDLGRISIASEEWQEAEKLLKQSIKLALVCHAVPLAIDAALELTECFIHRGELNEAAELVFFALEHPACTGAGQIRAKELRSAIVQEIDINISSMESLDVILARIID